MRWLTRLLPGTRRREIDEEIATHLEMAVRDRIDRGESPEEARIGALHEFGNVPLVADTTRRVWRGPALEQLAQDVRFGAKILRHAPGLSATAILLVALVVGGNTTIYATVRGILGSPAAGVRAERLVALKRLDPGAAISEPYFSYPNYRDFASTLKNVRGLMAWSDERLTVGIDAVNYAVNGALVTTNYFETLGSGLSVGRGLQPADDSLQNGLVAVISDRLWRDRFAQRPDIAGRVMTVNGNAATVVALRPRAFSAPR
jgi:putative ABC transport system permease protein